MGNFYTNFTLRGPVPEDIVQRLQGHSAIVTSIQNGSVVLFDEEAEANPDTVAELGSALSRQLHCPVLAVSNHDDDMLLYKLFVGGKEVDEYNSAPGYFGDEEEGETFEASGGDAEQLSEAFGARDVAAVDAVLQKPSTEDDGYLFAVDRHVDLVRALGLRTISCLEETARCRGGHVWKNTTAPRFTRP